MKRAWFLKSIAVVLCASIAGSGLAASMAADNALSAGEKKAGWQLLFDGKTLGGWQTSSGQPSKVPVEDGCINPHGCGGYMMIHQRIWADFVLALDFKISKGCNSGVFIRTFPLDATTWAKTSAINGIEVAIDDTKIRRLSRHRRDLRPGEAVPKNAMRPVGQWNHLVITGRRAKAFRRESTASS